MALLRTSRLRCRKHRVVVRFPTQFFFNKITGAETTSRSYFPQYSTAPCHPTSSFDTTIRPVAPVAYQVNLEPGIGQFREFEPRRVHTRINSLGLFLVDKLTCGKKARERELATLDEQSTSSGTAVPYAR